MAIALRNISKIFGDGTVALDKLDLAFERGEFLVLLGPSGSGKSTACRILAGLETPTSGTVEIDGKDITRLPPRERGMSMVFQNYALYPHKNVFDNIAYPLQVRGRDKRAVDDTVREIAAMLDIARLLKRRPRQLSGGEAQRVAVARALVWRPEICLMDEPLSNLDALLRLQTRTELKRIHRDLEQTFVFVTHDQEEAMSLGTRIAVMERGRLAQLDTPHEIYHHPATRFVAQFIGRPAMNVIDGELAPAEGGVERRAGQSELEFRAGELVIPLDASSAPARGAGPAALGIRPEAIELAGGPGAGALAMILDVKEVVEPDTLLTLERGGVTLVARSMRQVPEHRSGDELFIRLPASALHFFDTETGERLS